MRFALSIKTGDQEKLSTRVLCKTELQPRLSGSSAVGVDGLRRSCGGFSRGRATIPGSAFLGSVLLLRRSYQEKGGRSSRV